MLDMMSLDRTLAGRTAGRGIERPSCPAQRRVQQNHCDQAKHREKRTQAVWNACRHAVFEPSVYHTYIIRQQSLPAGASKKYSGARMPKIGNVLRLQILTWSAPRRRLEAWLTHTAFIFALISGPMRKRRSKRGTSWTAGGKHSGWTSAYNTRWTARSKARWKTRRNLRSPLRRPRHPQNPKKSPLRRARPKLLPNLARPRLRQSRRQLQTAKLDCWSGCIFLHTKSFQSSAGSRGFPRKSLSRALRRKSFIRAIRSSKPRMNSSKQSLRARSWQAGNRE